MVINVSIIYFMFCSKQGDGMPTILLRARQSRGLGVDGRQDAVGPPGKAGRFI